LRKLEGLAEQMEEPLVYGEERPEVLLIGWGSTCGGLRHAVDQLRAEGVLAGLVHFTDIWPLPKQRLRQAASLARADRAPLVERGFDPRSCVKEQEAFR
jgi:2-oxoglutarate ferredoxin oxidoreductase subunit alpha